MEINKHKEKALLLSYFTIVYNIVEGVIAVFFGYIQGSPSLFGFGLDSFVECLSGMVMVWRFYPHPNLTVEDEHKKEEHAIKLIGYTFFVFAAWVLYDSAGKLILQEAPEESLIGIIIAVISLIVMPILYFAKRDTSEKLTSRSLLKDAKQTLICMMLSTSLIIGLCLNYFFGLWWADPVAGLFIFVILIKEGIDAVKEQKLCTC